MDGIIPQLSRTDKRRLENPCRRTKEGAEKIRYLIIVHLPEGRSAADTARALRVHRSTVYRVAARFREGGSDGLIDHPVRLLAGCKSLSTRSETLLAFGNDGDSSCLPQRVNRAKPWVTDHQSVLHAECVPPHDETLKRFQRLRITVPLHLGLGSAADALEPNPRLCSVATSSLPRTIRAHIGQRALNKGHQTRDVVHGPGELIGVGSNSKNRFTNALRTPRKST